MEIFSALLTLCVGNSPVTGEFPSQRPVMRNFAVFLDQGLNKRLSKQSWGWWFETQSRSLWRHCNGLYRKEINSVYFLNTWINHSLCRLFLWGNQWLIDLILLNFENQVAIYWLVDSSIDTWSGQMFETQNIPKYTIRSIIIWSLENNLRVGCWRTD